MGCGASGTTFRVEVTVEKAENLANADGPFKGNDPYVWIDFESSNGVAGAKTKTINGGGNNPEWNEMVAFENVEINENTKLRLRIYDSDYGIDDNLGECKVGLADVPKTGVKTPLSKVVDAGIFSDAKLHFMVKVGEGDGAAPEPAPAAPEPAPAAPEPAPAVPEPAPAAPEPAPESGGGGGDELAAKRRRFLAAATKEYCESEGGAVGKFIDSEGCGGEFDGEEGRIRDADGDKGEMIDKITKEWGL